MTEAARNVFLERSGIGDNQSMEGQESGTDWKERMDRFEHGVEHLLETQARQQEMLGQALEAIHSLARIAESHERRISGLEGN